MYVNHGSLSSNAAKVKKTMNKEERNSHLVAFNAFLLRLMSQDSPVPNTLIVKDGKIDRLVWDGSFCLSWEYLSINDITSTDNDPEIMYGSMATDH